MMCGNIQCFYIARKLMQYTITFKSSTNHYKLVNYKMLAYSCAINVWSSYCNSLSSCCMLVSTTCISCTVIFILYVLYKLPCLDAIDTFL